MGRLLIIGVTVSSALQQRLWQYDACSARPSITLCGTKFKLVQEVEFAKIPACHAMHCKCPPGCASIQLVTDCKAGADALFQYLRCLYFLVRAHAGEKKTKTSRTNT
eukprot:2204300-Amphidinium_carterae.1